ncbi:MAG: hypothetical protein M0R03_16885 [Novosphingobium sp.]|nr:hypothetical protein [Novosphingobium sp.]
MIARLQIWLAGAAITVVAVVSSWFYGRRSGRKEAEVDELEEYRDTRKRMDQVVRDNDGADNAEWLRDRGSK